MSDDDLVLRVDFAPKPRIGDIVAASLHRGEYGLRWLDAPAGRLFFGTKARREARRARMARKKRRGWA